MTIKIADRFELWSVDHLKPYERNSRIHTADQVAGIASSIREFGFLAPIVVDTGRNRIAAGHGRLMAARLLGMREVPVIAVSHLTDAQFRAYVIADNKHTDNSAFDQAVLAAELADLAGEFDAEVLGFTYDELDALLPDMDATLAAKPPKVVDPNAVPESPANPVSARGDVWRLGPHRVMCGDSTSASDAGTLLDDRRAGRQAVMLAGQPFIARNDDRFANCRRA